MVIGKATKGECWYGHGREFYQLDGFVIEHEPLVQSDIPVGPCVARQASYGELWYALALTPYGSIPAKATALTFDRRGRCWYTYSQKELETSTFRYLCVVAP